jgi:putative alpha-1,2-mannosidase
MKIAFFLSLVLAAVLGCSSAPKTPIEAVNVFNGTGFHGHTYPGATTPFGLVQLSPDTRTYGWDGCSGYPTRDGE